MATKPSSRSPRPPAKSGRGRQPTGARAAVAGHEEDLVGILLIAIAVVLALGIYGH